MRRWLLAGCVLMMSTWVEAQTNPRLVDISQTAPADFPTDGAALALGDHVGTPTFFWKTTQGLRVAQVDSAGIFTPLAIDGLSAVPTTISELQMAPRSYWANAVFFWSLGDNRLSLWAIRDSGTGFSLTKVISRYYSVQKLPEFWVMPYGRRGWVVVENYGQELVASFYGFDGTVKDWGVVYRFSDGPINVSLMERPDLDSGHADLILRTAASGGTIQLIPLDGMTIGGARQVASYSGPSLDSVFLIYGPNPEPTELIYSRGSQVVRSGLAPAFRGSEALALWVDGIKLAHVTGVGPQGAIVAYFDDTSQFYWIPDSVPSSQSAQFTEAHWNPGLGTSSRSFPSGLPLLTDGFGTWGYFGLDGWTVRTPNGQETSVRSNWILDPQRAPIWINQRLVQSLEVQVSGEQLTGVVVWSPLEATGGKALDHFQLSEAPSSLGFIVKQLLFPDDGVRGQYWGVPIPTVAAYVAKPSWNLGESWFVRRVTQ